MHDPPHKNLSCETFSPLQITQICAIYKGKNTKASKTIMVD